jgi:GNAT superfamily N-acetyltransferase
MIAAAGWTATLDGRARLAKTCAMNKPTLRIATVEDVPLILDFIRGLADYEKLAHQVDATEALLAEHLFGAKPMAEVVFAVTPDGQEAGFALFFNNFSTFRGKPGIYLEDLFVKVEYRGAGYGKALLAHLAHLAIERGYARVDWAVLDWNEPAIRFYENLGAHLMADWRFCRLTGPPLEALAASAR